MKLKAGSLVQLKPEAHYDMFSCVHLSVRGVGAVKIYC